MLQLVLRDWFLTKFQVINKCPDTEIYYKFIRDSLISSDSGWTTQACSSEVKVGNFIFQ